MHSTWGGGGMRIELCKHTCNKALIQYMRSIYQSLSHSRCENYSTGGTHGGHCTGATHSGQHRCYTQWSEQVLHTVVRTGATHSGQNRCYTQWSEQVLHTVVRTGATHSGQNRCYTQWSAQVLHTVVSTGATHSGHANN